jgi:hypothetical protein
MQIGTSAPRQMKLALISGFQLQRWLLAIFILVCLLLLAPSPVHSNPIQRSRPVVITTDCGADIDDQWTIAHASLAPELKLLAVIGNFAPRPHNLTSAQTTSCAHRVLEVLRRGRGIGLYRGADRPLPNRAVPVPNEGVRAMMRLARNSFPSESPDCAWVGSSDGHSFRLADRSQNRRPH